MFVLCAAPVCAHPFLPFVACMGIIVYALCRCFYRCCVLCLPCLSLFFSLHLSLYLLYMNIPPSLSSDNVFAGVCGRGQHGECDDGRSTSGGRGCGQARHLHRMRCCAQMKEDYSPRAKYFIKFTIVYCVLSNINK